MNIIIRWFFVLIPLGATKSPSLSVSSQFMPHVIHSTGASQSKHTGAFSLLHVRLTVLEQALPDESLAQQELDVLLRPTLSRKGLQEHHDFLEVHLAELVGPFY